MTSAEAGTACAFVGATIGRPLRRTIDRLGYCIRQWRATNGRPYGSSLTFFSPIVILNAVKDPAQRHRTVWQDPSSFHSSG